MRRPVLFYGVASDKNLTSTTKVFIMQPLPFGKIRNMNVYLEYVILDNLVIDCLLLFAASATLKLRVKKLRIFLGGLCGAACAVLSVFVGGAWLYAVKAVCLFLMCVIAVGFGKKLFWHVLLTLAYTFVLGGAVIGIFNVLKIDYLNENGLFYELKVPLFVYVLAAAVAMFLCYCVVAYVKQLKKVAPFLVKAVVTLDKDYSIVGFCDSGNSLCFEGVPVCFVTRNFGNFTEYFALQTVKGFAKDIRVSTVGGECLVKAVKAAVSVNGEKKNVYLALPKEKCRTNHYDMILSNEFCNVLQA